MKVLVVDDDVDLLDLMTYALRREGYNVLAAVDGQQALQRWESENPDIVLLDGNLPKIDGFEVCRRIRHESKTPIIMLTARDEEEDILRGLQIGADDYMTKPFSAKQLAARMKAVMLQAAIAAAEGCQTGVLMRRAWDLFGTHLRKQNDVADARAVGQQHHEPVDADAGARGRRQAVFERADVIGVVMHCLLVAGFFLLRLLEKTLRLVFGVVQLGESVGELAARHV